MVRMLSSNVVDSELKPSSCEIKQNIIWSKINYQLAMSMECVSEWSNMYTCGLLFKILKIPKGVIRISVSKKNRQHNGQKNKVQKDKQRSTKHTYKTKDRVTRTPLNSGGELRCSGRVSSSCSTSGTRRVNLVTNPVISGARGKDRKVFTTSGTYPWSFVTQIFHNDQPSNGGDVKFSK